MSRKWACTVPPPSYSSACISCRSARAGVVAARFHFPVSQIAFTDSRYAFVANCKRRVWTVPSLGPWPNVTCSTKPRPAASAAPDASDVSDRSICFPRRRLGKRQRLEHPAPGAQRRRHGHTPANRRPHTPAPAVRMSALLPCPITLPP